MLPFTRLHGVARLPVYLHSPVYKLVCSERVHRRLDFARLPVYMHLPVYPSTCYARLPPRWRLFSSNRDIFFCTFLSVSLIRGQVNLDTQTWTSKSAIQYPIQHPVQYDAWMAGLLSMDGWPAGRPPCTSTPRCRGGF